MFIMIRKLMQENLSSTGNLRRYIVCKYLLTGLVTDICEILYRLVARDTGLPSAAPLLRSYGKV